MISVLSPLTPLPHLRHRGNLPLFLFHLQLTQLYFSVLQLPHVSSSNFASYINTDWRQSLECGARSEHRRRSAFELPVELSPAHFAADPTPEAPETPYAGQSPSEEKSRHREHLSLAIQRQPPKTPKPLPHNMTPPRTPSSLQSTSPKTLMA